MEIPNGTIGFITAVLGGLIVAASNWLFSGDTRKLTRAQTEKVEEETRLLKMKPRASAADPGVWGEPPAGWLAGNVEGASADYVVGVDQLQMHTGKASAYIRAKTDAPQGFGALSQRFHAGSFQGKRVRLAGYLRVKSVAGWAGLWMHIDGADGNLQGFDNMEQRPVKGTSEWVRREVVLNVPADAFAIAIGALLVGPGQVWVDDFMVEVVGDDVPTTVAEETVAEDLLNEFPVNLNFEAD
jgi:hypothetical protein